MIRIVVLSDGETWEVVTGEIYVVELTDEEFSRISNHDEKPREVVNLQERGKKIV